MFSTSENRDAATTEKRRLKSHGTDRFVIEPVALALSTCELPGRELLGPVCKFIWPSKTAEKVAAIAGKDARTGARWLSGEVEPPPIIFTAIQVALTRW